ncbi:MAG: response regulator [Flavipsychrobacter sp.]|nr:response regulator [Flavipsychrobacter sp.]
MSQTKKLPKKLHFIVIDDSKLDCFIAEKIIKNTGRSESITQFLQAQEAIKYIAAAPPPSPDCRTIILVDIQMPVMNGFEFVEAFEKLSESITSGYTIYVISSSINENDIHKLQSYSSVKQFLNKPINSNMLASLLV